MADTPTPNITGFDFAPGRISGDDCQSIATEREDFVKKQLAAGNEFMYQHYARMLREVEKSYERATKANIVLERKQRRDEAKKRRDSLKAQAVHR